MASYTVEFRSWLTVNGFSFSEGPHGSVGRSPTFRVSSFSRDQLIGEEIQ